MLPRHAERRLQPMPPSSLSTAAPLALLPPAGLKALRAAGDGSTRFRVLLSDGRHSHPAMLATGLSHLVTAGALREGGILRVDDFMCQDIHGKR